MNYNTATVPTQMDIIDFMLQHDEDIPLLDMSMLDKSVTEEQLHYEGFDAPHADMDDTDILLAQEVENASRFRAH